MVRAHYVDSDVTYAEKTAETVLSLNADFSSGIPSRSFPENFSFGPDIKIFRNGRSRAVRSTHRVPEIRKNRFSLWIPVSHLESVQDHPWRCFTKTRSQDIWKRSVTGCPSAPGPVCHWDLCAKNRKKTVLSLDTRFSSGIRPGPSLEVFNED